MKTKKCQCIFISWDYHNITDPNYKYGNKKKAGAILTFNNKLLIVQSRGNLWGFPKGTMEYMETELECASREVLEETSLSLNFEGDSMFVYNNTTFFFKQLSSVYISLNHIMSNPSNDCTGIGWIDINCLKDMMHNRGCYAHIPKKMNASFKKFINCWAQTHSS
jgi:hypothetical protein